MSWLGLGLIVSGVAMLFEGARRYHLSMRGGYPGTHREVEIPKAPPPPTKDA
jgi:hypothetical protein